MDAPEPRRSKRIKVASQGKGKGKAKAAASNRVRRPCDRIQEHSTLADIVDILEEYQTFVLSYSSLSGPSPKKNTETILRKLIPHTHFSIQNTPPTGDCFFYSIALIISRNVRHYATDNEVPDILMDLMLCLRKICAVTIYNHVPEVDERGRPDIPWLQYRFAWLEEEEQAAMEWFDPEQKPNRKLYMDYYLALDDREVYPFADQLDISVVQRLPFFNESVIVIFNTNQLRKAEAKGRAKRDDDDKENWVCNIYYPERYDHLILLRRSGIMGGGEHFQPVVFCVRGQWQHELPIAEKNGPVYRPLFQDIARQCEEFGHRVLNPR